VPITDRQLAKLLSDIKDLKKLALRQASEIKALKALIINKRKPLPTGAYVHIGHSYEWGCPTIRISPKNWKRIKSGEHITLRGQGWRFNDYFDEVSDEQFFHWDYWEFQGGLDKPLIVTMKSKEYSEEVVHIGDLHSSMVEEFKVKPKSEGA